MSKLIGQMYWFFAVLLASAAAQGVKPNIKALKPCFEHYADQSLIEVRPFHSEWRMKSGEDCLSFCASASSRCRAIVHDSYQHICHYFTDDGTEHAILYRGSSYFRVASKECLVNYTTEFGSARQTFSKPSAPRSGEYYNSDAQPTTFSTPKETTTPVPKTTSESRPESRPEFWPESRPESKPEPKSKPEPRPQPDPEVHHDSGKQHGIKTHIEPEMPHERESEQELGTSFESKYGLESEAGLEYEDGIESEAMREPEPQPEPEPKFDLDTQPEPELSAEFEAAPSESMKPSLDYEKRGEREEEEDNIEPLNDREETRSSLKQRQKQRSKATRKEKLNSQLPGFLILESRVPDAKRIQHKTATYTSTALHKSSKKSRPPPERSSEVREPELPVERITSGSGGRITPGSGGRITSGSGGLGMMDVMGAAMLPPMQMHKQTRIKPDHGSKMMHKKQKPFEDLRRSPMRHSSDITQHAEKPNPELPLSNKWESSVEETEADRKANFNVRKIEDSQERSDVGDMQLLNEEGKVIGSFAPKTKKTSLEGGHFISETDESVDGTVMLEEGQEQRNDVGLEGLEMNIPTMKVMSMKMTKQDNKRNRAEPRGKQKAFKDVGACPNNEHDIWLSLENSIMPSNKPQRRLSAQSASSCKTKCNRLSNEGVNCPAVTYDESANKCTAHINNARNIDNMQLRPAKSNDFSTRTLVKLCFPESLKAFTGCTEFTSFRDYTLEIAPREQFEGMPKGIAGLKACLELCVLSSDFYCKSASFLLDEGKCLIRDENSLSMPNEFREHLKDNEIYFENGCEHFFSNDYRQTSEDAQMIRVPLKSSLKSTRIQRDRRNDWS